MLFDDSARAECCCFMNDYRAFTGLETERLRLTSPCEISACRHFVAVSYCWKSWLREQDLMSYEIVTSDGVRRDKTSSRLIEWAVSYAASESMPFIWIDQECIEQSDNAEKQAHINEMDRIFRRATRVIAPLTTTVDFSNYIDVVSSRQVCYELHKRLNVHAAHRLGIRMSEDDWFGRAWTLQENMSATRHLDFLVPVNRHFDERGFVVVWPHFFRSLALGVFGGLYGAAKHRMLPMALARTYSGCDPLRPEEQRLNAEQSLKALMCKGIQLPEDRMSITANMCRYATRLNLAKCQRSGIDNATCMFAQSLLNGDMSLILAYRSYLEPQNKASHLGWTAPKVSLSAVLGHRDPPRDAYGDEWCGYACLSLETSGIRVRGQLWVRRYLVDFAELCSQHCRSISLSAMNRSEQYEVLELMLAHLLQLSVDLPLMVGPLAMALILGRRHMTFSIRDENTGSICETSLDETETLEKLSATEILSWICFPPRSDNTRAISTLMEAKVEIYVPLQSKQSFRGSVIFWNSTVHRAPEALLTTRKTALHVGTLRAPLIAWTLRSASVENGYELTLDDHLPRELPFIRKSDHSEYCGFASFDSYLGAARTPEAWQEEYLLKRE